MAEAVNKIVYKPYRGGEEITQIRKSEVTFYPNHIETSLDYDYVTYFEDEPIEDTIKDVVLLPK